MRDRPPTVIGCVSFLNSKPLIDGLEGDSRVRLVLDVPSRLLPRLLAGEVDLALCPTIDYQLSPEPLEIVPVGGIGCDGPTLTVRLFSRTPFEEIREVRVDGDSHTSVALLRVLLDRRCRTLPSIVPLGGDGDTGGDTSADALLLIGDKVVGDAPSDDDYPYQLDLGEEWKADTGLPFVFATWMARPETELGPLPELLTTTRRENSARIDDIVARWAPELGWPGPLAREYLGGLLRYAIGGREIEAIERFWALAHRVGASPRHRPLSYAAPARTGSVVRR